MPRAGFVQNIAANSLRPVWGQKLRPFHWAHGQES